MDSHRYILSLIWIDGWPCLDCLQMLPRFQFHIHWALDNYIIIHNFCWKHQFLGTWDDVTGRKKKKSAETKTRAWNWPHVSYNDPTEVGSCIENWLRFYWLDCIYLIQYEIGNSELGTWVHLEAFKFILCTRIRM